MASGRAQQDPMDSFKTRQVETIIRMQDKILIDVLWLPNGRGLITRYTEKLSPIARAQIGYVSYPGGRIRQHHPRHQRLRVAVLSPATEKRLRPCNKS